MGKVTLPEEHRMKYSYFKGGTSIFHQGDDGTDIYVLKKGAVTVIVDNQIMGLINTANTIIGEMAYFLGLKRTASIEAIEDCEFLVIPGDLLYETVLKNPEIGIELIKILSVRLANTTKFATKLENDIGDYRNELRKLNALKDDKRPTFSEDLVAYGVVTKEQMEECMEDIEKRKKAGESVSLPKVLIEKKFITAQQLMQFLEMKQKK
jgi:CRP-like cAMP-binding protein